MICLAKFFEVAPFLHVNKLELSMMAETSALPMKRFVPWYSALHVWEHDGSLLSVTIKRLPNLVVSQNKQRVLRTCFSTVLCVPPLLAAGALVLALSVCSFSIFSWDSQSPWAFNGHIQKTNHFGRLSKQATGTKDLFFNAANFYSTKTTTSVPATPFSSIPVGSNVLGYHVA